MLQFIRGQISSNISFRSLSLLIYKKKDITNGPNNGDEDDIPTAYNQRMGIPRKKDNRNQRTFTYPPQHNWQNFPMVFYEKRQSVVKCLRN